MTADNLTADQIGEWFDSLKNDLEERGEWYAGDQAVLDAVESQARHITELERDLAGQIGDVKALMKEIDRLRTSSETRDSEPVAWQSRHDSSVIVSSKGAAFALDNPIPLYRQSEMKNDLARQCTNALHQDAIEVKGKALEQSCDE